MATLLALLCAAAATTPVAEDSSPPPQIVGDTSILFDDTILANLGIAVVAPLPTAEPFREGALGFAVPAPVQLEYTGAYPSTNGFSAGSIPHVGGFTLDVGGATIAIHDFELRALGSGLYSFDLYDGDGNRWFRVESMQYDYSNDDTELHLINASLVLSPELAKAIGRADLANTYVGAIDTILPIDLPTYVGPQGALSFQGAEACPLPNPADPIDVALTGLNSLTQLGREAGGRVSLAPSADLTNVGVGSVEWYRTIEPDDVAADVGPHPYLALHFYRLVDGRMEQIGRSDVKHAFLSINTGCPCEPGHILYPGCSDVYSQGTNAFRRYLGPRDEVSAFTGAWTRLGSHFDSYDQAMGAIDPALTDDMRSHDTPDHTDDFEHRLVVQEPDLQTPGAQYFMEAWYIVKDDIDIMNSMGHRRVTPALADSIWSFTNTSNLVNGSILDEFVNPTNPVAGSLSTQVDTGEGRLHLAVRTTNLNNGMFHYEYALMNFDFDRKVASFSVPLPAGVTVANVAFGDVDDDAGNDWTSQVTPGSSIVFTAQPGNELDWGTLFNFSFDSNAPGANGTATLTALESGVGLAGVATLTPDPSGILPGGDDIDDCADRRVIGTGTTFGTLAGASNDGSSADDDPMLGPFRDVWYEFTPSRSGEVRFYTCGSSDIPTVDNGVDTVLSIHDGCPGTTANEIYSNNDAPFGDAQPATDPGACQQIGSNGEVLDQGLELDAAIAINLTAGTPYVIRVAEFDDFGANDFLLTVLEPPVNDLVSNPTTIGLGATAGTLDQANADSPDDPGDPNRMESQPDVWYRFDPPSTGDYRFSTCGTFVAAGMDTVIDVFEFNTAELLGGNDDYEFGNDPRGCDGVMNASVFDSSFAVERTNLDPLQIRVSRFAEGATGNFVLHVEKPQFGVDLAALPETVGVGESTTLSWYGFQGTNCVASDGWVGARPKSGTEVVTPMGTTTYRLTCELAGGMSTNFSEITVDVQSLPNDACDTPVVISQMSLPFTQTIETSIASADLTDPDTAACRGNPGFGEQDTVWYQYTPSTSGPVQISTFGSAYDTVVSVWNGTPGCGSLSEQIACNDDADGSTLQSQLEFTATAGTTYLIQVGEYGGALGGRLELSVPEPGARMLSAVALLTLVLLRRRLRVG